MSIETLLVAQLKKRGETLSVAESCTGGMLGEHITRVPGSSEVFLGGVISYAYSAKTDLLSVSQADLQSYGAVSEPVAKQMANGVRKLLHSTWSIAITGIAGPDGGTPEKPVGTVWFSISHESMLIAKKIQFPHRSRQEIREATCEAAMAWLLESLR